MASKRGGKRTGAGRPRGAPTAKPRSAKVTLAEMARDLTEVALAALTKVAKSGESESARVSAAIAILDRGYGKPLQGHQHTGANGGPIQTVDLSKLSDDELSRLESILGPLAVSGGDPGGEGKEGSAG